MDNFNLRKYLVENKRTTNSRELKEYIEDQGSITDAFTQAGINSNDTVTLRITADRGDTTLEPMSTPEAINYIESKAQGSERTYSFDDPEGDGAKLNINLSDDLAIDVYTTSEDQGPIADAFAQAGIALDDSVTLRITSGREETKLKPMSTQEAITYIELKAQGLERTYSFDDPEEDGAKLNINLSNDLAIDVYTTPSIMER
tara:strand:+ start:51 stop:656 length:606 start_codon:yes stop_codon:yes gene_type:complete